MSENEEERRRWFISSQGSCIGFKGSITAQGRRWGDLLSLSRGSSLFLAGYSNLFQRVQWWIFFILLEGSGFFSGWGIYVGERFVWQQVPTESWIVLIHIDKDFLQQYGASLVSSEWIFSSGNPTFWQPLLIIFLVTNQGVDASSGKVLA